MVGLALGRDVEDRATAGNRRDVAGEEAALGDEHAGRAGPSRKLVRRHEDGVLVRELAVLDFRIRVHVDRKVGRGRCGVPTRERAVPVEQDRDGVGVRDDAGHVRGRREAPDLERACGMTSSAQRRCSRSNLPSASSRMTTTSAGDSRHGSSLEWCSKGPTKTTGSDAASNRSIRTSRSIAPVAPEPQKTTTSSTPPPTARWMTPRASSRKSVVCRPGRRGLGVRVRVERQDSLPDGVLNEAE